MNSIGYKTALTSKALQDKFSVTEPAYDVIYGECGFSGNSKFALEEGKSYRLECELAVVLKMDADHVPESKEELLSMIDYVFPALEIISSPEGKEQTIEDFIGNHCNYEATVWGDYCASPYEIDWNLLGMRLEINGILSTSGTPEGVDGTPLGSLSWLIGRLLKDGKMLKAGEIVMTGSFVPSVPVKKGDYARASYYKLGDVAVIFE